jgi:O-antigen/teichoic acid export membrane protein
MSDASTMPSTASNVSVTGSDGPDSSVLSDEYVGRRVIFGSAQRGLGLAISSLFTAASAVVLLHYLRPASFGRYGTVIALVGVVYGISDMGLTATGSRELALCETGDERREVLAHILGLRIVVTSVGVIVAVAFAALAGYAQALILGTLLAGIGVLLQSVQAAMLMPLSVELRNGALAVNQVLTQAVLLAGFGILAAVGAGLVPFFAVQILVGVAMLAVVPLMLSREHIVAPRLTPARIVRLGRVALPIAVATVLGVLYLRLLVITMSLLSSKPAQIGYFVTSTRVLELVAGLPFLVVSIVLPVVTVAARDDRDRLVYMTSRVAQTMLLGGAFVALVLWTLSGTVVRVLGGARYGPAGQVLQIQGFATVTIFLTAAWQSALVGMHRLRSLVIALGAGVLAVIVAGAILIPPFQATGAAVAAVAGEAVLCLSVYLAVRQAGPGEWLPVGTALRVGAAAAAAVAAGLIPGIPEALRAVIVAGVFIAAAVILRTVPSELSDVLKGVMVRLRSSGRADSQ